ncbi:hypothetical protein U1Q18_022376 [Sarracenia purpurea var. burkii]
MRSCPMVPRINALHLCALWKSLDVPKKIPKGVQKSAKMISQEVQKCALTMPTQVQVQPQGKPQAAKECPTAQQATGHAAAHRQCTAHAPSAKYAQCPASAPVCPQL